MNTRGGVDRALAAPEDGARASVALEGGRSLCFFQEKAMYCSCKGPKRAPNAYAKFVREMMASYKFPSGTSQTDKMKIISREWRNQKENILNDREQ